MPSFRQFTWVLASLVVSSTHAVASLDTEIAGIVSGGIREGQVTAWPPKSRDWVKDVYSSGNYEPVWFTPAGPRPAVDAAIRALRGAAERGLTAPDYAIETLQRQVIAASANGGSTEIVATADVALTRAVLLFLSDLRYGRVRPSDVEPHFETPAKNANFTAELRGAVAGDRLASLIDASEPDFPLYARLEQALAHYRILAMQTSSPLPMPAPPRAPIAPGATYAGVAGVYEHLVRTGDLAADTEAPADDRYTDSLAAGVKRFQIRHGLRADGILGKETIAALNVPLAARVEQIELSLERLRWLPQLRPGPLVAVNIPSFTLWASADAPVEGTATLSMPVIVGKAMRAETPVFIGEMRAVEFSPYWNVPSSILQNELLPQLARDPAMLAREDLELVGPGRVRPAITTLDGTGLDALRSGSMRLRQRPGPKNALGGVKFVLPNTMDIYLHGTPARSLFEQSRRDFSHGCIRVAEPAALAQLVLRDQPEWTPAKIDEAMQSGTNRTVPLAVPIPVVVFYTTAIVDTAGRVLFAVDVYGHDRRLRDALSAASRQPR